jgi:hypothetical protein
MTYAIEKGIPAPDLRLVRKKLAKYPFAKMRVGDSFFSILDSTKRISPSIAAFYKKNPTKRFTCRKVEGGTRVWRIK